MPVSGLHVAIAAATSPSEMRRMRAPARRTSAMRSWWRGRSRMIAVRSSTLIFLVSAMRVRFQVGLLLRSMAPRASGPTAILSM